MSGEKSLRTGLAHNGMILPALQSGSLLHLQISLAWPSPVMMIETLGATLGVTCTPTFRGCLFLKLGKIWVCDLYSAKYGNLFQPSVHKYNCHILEVAPPILSCSSQEIGCGWVWLKHEFNFRQYFLICTNYYQIRQRLVCKL